MVLHHVHVLTRPSELLDWSELDGFASGREAGIREHQIRKEIRETRALIQKYYDRKRDATPERRIARVKAARAFEERNPERALEHRKRYEKSAKGKAKRQRNQEKKKIKRDLKRDAHKGEVIMCTKCGTTFCRIQRRVMGRKPKYCGFGRCTMNLPGRRRGANGKWRSA